MHALKKTKRELNEHEPQTDNIYVDYVPNKVFCVEKVDILT